MADFILWWFFVLRRRFLHSACAPVGMTTGGRFYGFAYCFRNVSGRPAPHQSGLRPANFPGGEAFVPGFRVPSLPVRLRKAPKNLPRRGRGTARRRWMRGGTALNIVGTMGAEVENHRICHSERSETESRNLPEWQILPCVGTFLPRGGFLHSANAPVGMTRWGDVSTDSPIVSRMFQVVPLPHQSGLRPASFPGGEAFVPGFRVPSLPVRLRKALKKPSPPGKGNRPQAVDEGRYGVFHCRNNGRRGRNPPYMSFRAG